MSQERRVQAAAGHERELAALERLYQRLGRRPSKAERDRAEQIAYVTEQWRAQMLAGGTSPA